MNVALIFAGGSGKRMTNASVPKQFLELYGKPIIIYTLEKFENHEDIQGIVVVCIREWIPKMRSYIRKFGITKVKAIVPGGATGQECDRARRGDRPGIDLSRPAPDPEAVSGGYDGAGA